ncbi:hypothetical protein [Nocardia beijingensis]|uniref:Uncharacterized protein n=1 Tax=Nocardia beijingensis TaxID=95162 RepID=A0ABW7WQF2_9NOCA
MPDELGTALSSIAKLRRQQGVSARRLFGLPTPTKGKPGADEKAVDSRTEGLAGLVVRRYHWEGRIFDVAEIATPSNTVAAAAVLTEPVRTVMPTERTKQVNRARTAVPHSAPAIRVGRFRIAVMTGSYPPASI